MRCLLTIVFFIALISGVAAHPLRSDSTLTLTGDIRGLGHHRIIFYYYPTDSTYHGDTIRAHHGHFVFTTHLTEPTCFNITTLRDHPGKLNKRTGYSLSYIGRYGLHYATFRDALLENRTMTWKVSKMSGFRTSAISNAPLNDTLMYIEDIPARIYRNDKALNTWKKQNLLLLEKTMSGRKLIERDIIRQSMFKKQGDSIAAYIIAHPSSYASANTLWRVLYSDHSVKEAAYNALDTSFRHLSTVRSFKKRMDRTTAHISQGDIAPDISLADTSGRVVSLYSFRGRVTLVDFWASWCGPCRRENSNIVSAYRKFHKKGLEIYAVSLDMSKYKWKAAIQQDNLAWTHVSDLKDWESTAAKAYGVRGIPNNFLLDKDGKVIAINLRGNELISVLNDILK